MPSGLQLGGAGADRPKSTSATGGSDLDLVDLTMDDSRASDLPLDLDAPMKSSGRGAPPPDASGISLGVSVVRWCRT